MKPLSLYQHVMGADFDRLPAPLQAFHVLAGPHVLNGAVEVGAPETWPAKALAWCLGAPQLARQGPIRFELQADGTSEVWTRHFPGRTMTSRLTLVGGRIVERLGAARLGFELRGSPQKLEMHLVRLHFLGVPCPRWLMPAIVAEETASEGRLHFEIRASLPLVGVVTRYRGHLDVPS